MRRNLMSHGSFSSFRSGVIERVMSRKRSVQSPVTCVIFSIGFAPSPAPQVVISNGARPKNPQRSQAKGISEARNTPTLAMRIIGWVWKRMDDWKLVITGQIHTRVHACDLIISIKHQRRTWPKFAQTALVSLAVITLHIRIYV